MRRLLKLVLVAAVLVAAGLWLTRPEYLPPDALVGKVPDIENGKVVFAAMGCASCHTAPNSEDHLILAGGKSFVTDFGTFYAPNISTDPVNGIGAWSDLEIATAIVKGTSPKGQHYYPVFPYGSYNRADLHDVADLIGYLRTLAPDETANKPHDVGFPFSIRETLGGWKMLFVDDDWIVDGDLSDEELRGRELVEALGHCGECHTPRNALGGMKHDEWLAGAAIPGSKGRTPDIRAEKLDWSSQDIVAYLDTGFTPEYDVAGGEMADVILNTQQLPDSDLEAIAAYLLRDAN